MLRKRVIPVLLLQNKGLTKSVKFKDYTYIGDPINAVRIFNEKEVDEIVLLDINASLEKRNPDFHFISEIGSEAFIPFAYGGGITNIAQVKKIMFAGAEKVVLNSVFLRNPSFVSQVADYIGSSSTVVSIDVKKNFRGKYRVYSHLTKKTTDLLPVDMCKKAEELGAGELFINSVDMDGTMKGYDIDLFKELVSEVNIPVIACGGASGIADMKAVIKETNIDALAAGSMFVFHGKHRAVLINYINPQERQQLV